MGLLTATVIFNGELPSIPIILGALQEHAGEEILYDAEMQELSCKATGDTFGLAPLDEEASYWLHTTNLGIGYLWDATLFVLQSLGGTYAYPLRDFAHQPWKSAKELFLWGIDFNWFWCLVIES